MRHKVKGFRLNRSSGHRTAMRRTMIRQLFEHERIKTTLPKAKSIQPHAEKLITLARNAQNADEIVGINARRKASAELGNGSRPIVQKLFDDIGPRYVSRNGGYTRILKLGPRLSDGAEMAVIELVED
ncbi:MAG TPA: 50S ribosomal protein L17 [Brevefilum fermentans]|jgi:large subunit ribosomal protein L17|nr:50S ribosomal protein L17 [Brevefilum fermentans]HQA28105.1 50S ribosomal protein L17 [Brevefilum fermentans]